MAAEVAVLRDAQELDDDTADKLEAANEALRRSIVLPGGGGDGSVRNQISQLIGMYSGPALRKRDAGIKWAPASAATAAVAVGLYSFHAAAPGELSFRKGDMLRILSVPAESTPDGWKYASSANGVGLVPESYVETRVHVPTPRVRQEEQAMEERRRDRRLLQQQRSRTSTSGSASPDGRAAKHLGISVEEWRALPPDVRPAHLLGPKGGHQASADSISQELAPGAA